MIALGTLADDAWRAYAAAKSVSVGYVHITHPTAPESGAGNDPARHAGLIKQMLANWNHGLDLIAPHIAHPDHARPLKHYGQSFKSGDQIPIPLGDLPAGTPAWMATDDGWATRGGGSAGKRATITVTVPAGELP